MQLSSSNFELQSKNLLDSLGSQIWTYDIKRSLVKPRNKKKQIISEKNCEKLKCRNIFCYQYEFQKDKIARKPLSLENATFF
jgi:hypothetical protein